MPERDTQLIELAGRHHLISELILAGLEVAEPLRDRGVDLIAYAELSEKTETFVAKPIQLKASSVTGFGINRKYARISDLILAFVWHLGLDSPDKTVTYALTYPEAVAIADQKGWTKTASWEKGAYTVTSPGKDVLDLLRPHQMTKEKWWAKVAGST